MIEDGIATISRLDTADSSRIFVGRKPVFVNLSRFRISVCTVEDDRPLGIAICIQIFFQITLCASGFRKNDDFALRIHPLGFTKAPLNGFF